MCRTLQVPLVSVAPEVRGASPILWILVGREAYMGGDSLAPVPTFALSLAANLGDKTENAEPCLTRRAGPASQALEAQARHR